MPDVLETASEAQVAANRANAQLSTGPRSAEGKQRSSLNAMKHGLTGRTVLLPKEDPEEHKKFSRRIINSLKAETPEEEELAQVIADQYWRLRRMAAIEDKLMEQEEATIQDFNTLSIYQQRITRVLHEAKRDLREMQAERKRQERATLPEAMRLYKLHKMLDLPWEPRTFGFDYSAADLEQEIDNERLRTAAIGAARWDYNRAKLEASMAEKREKGQE